jgi:septal ring factor EnvC (AmiA/AmiB activator)
MSEDVLRQRALNGDEEALDELIHRLAEVRKQIAEQRKRAAEQRKRAAEQRKRAAEQRKRADELQSLVTQLEHDIYVYNLTNRCTIQYLRMRPAYMPAC